MKQGLHLAAVYIGLVIGAGFASGREIMEYFNIPNLHHNRGVVIATLLLTLVCYRILRRAYQYRLFTCKEYLTSLCGPLAPWVNRFLLCYLFCGFFTMLAGCGALLNQSLMLPSWLGSFLLLILCFAVLVFDLKGIIALNLLLVPCMIGGILFLCFAGILTAEPVFASGSIVKGTLLSAICYVSYNTVSAPTVLVPLAKDTTPKSIRIAAWTGGLVLGSLIFLIWTCQSLYFPILENSEIPLLHLAALIGRSEKLLYTAVLFMAITTTAVSEGFGILSQIPFSSRKERVIGVLLFCLAAYPFSLIGFSSLIKYIYGLFGILGIFLMGWLILDR